MRPCLGVTNVKVFLLAHKILQSIANKPVHMSLGAELWPCVLLK